VPLNFFTNLQRGLLSPHRILSAVLEREPPLWQKEQFMDYLAQHQSSRLHWQKQAKLPRLIKNTEEVEKKIEEKK